MSDQESESAIPQPRVERSQDFKTFFCNQFKFRFNIGDISITLSQFDEDPGSPTQNILREQVNFTMSWPQLKQLAAYATVAIQEMEREFGPIPRTGFSDAELQEQARSIVSGFMVQK